jgi:excisionase family DNA binding protein
MMLEDYITTQEAARILNMTVQGVRQRARQGDLGAVKFGGVWFLRRDDVIEYRDRVRGKAKHDPTRGEQ